MPMVSLMTDQDTQSGVNWIPNAGPLFTINGTPVAIMGGISYPYRIIVQGSAAITVNGIPVAYFGAETVGYGGSGTMLATQALVSVSV